MSERNDVLGLVGAGSVAHALAAALARGPVRVWARRPEAAQSVADHSNAVPAQELSDLAPCDALIVAVSDGAIPEIAGRIARELPLFRGEILHTSGAFTAEEVLGNLVDTGAALGSLHPLVAVSSHGPAAPDVFEGMPFAIEGDVRATRLATQLVGEVGAFELHVAGEDKARYHALATMVATGVVTLVDRAADSMSDISPPDPEREEAFRRAYAALALSAVRNVGDATGPAVLTGAVARGDEELIARHVNALRGRLVGDLYRSIVRGAQGMLDGTGGSE